VPVKYLLRWAPEPRLFDLFDRSKPFKMSFAVAIGCGLVIGAIIIIVDSRRNNRTDVGSLAQTPETEVQSTETQDLPERPIDQELELPDQDLQQIRSSKLHRHTKELARVLGGSDDAAVSAQVIGYDEARAAAIKGAKTGEDEKIAHTALCVVVLISWSWVG